MLRLTKKADYGLMALKYLAEHRPPGARRGRAERQGHREAYHIPPPLLAKILQTLARGRVAGLPCRHQRWLRAGSAGA